MLSTKLTAMDEIVARYGVSVIQTQRHFEDDTYTIILSHNIYYVSQAKMAKELFTLGNIRGIIYKEVS